MSLKYALITRHKKVFVLDLNEEIELYRQEILSTAFGLTNYFDEFGTAEEIIVEVLAEFVGTDTPKTDRKEWIFNSSLQLVAPRNNFYDRIMDIFEREIRGSLNMKRYEVCQFELFNHTARIRFSRK